MVKALACMSPFVCAWFGARLIASSSPGQRCMQVRILLPLLEQGGIEVQVQILAGAQCPCGVKTAAHTLCSAQVHSIIG